MRLDLTPNAADAANPAYVKGREILERMLIAAESHQPDKVLDFFADDAVLKHCHLPATLPTRESKRSFFQWAQKLSQKIEIAVKSFNITNENITTTFDCTYTLDDGTEKVEYSVNIQRDPQASNVVPVLTIVRQNPDKLSHTTVFANLTPENSKHLTKAGPIPTHF
ncbi:hypothetical protein FA15DRAFT_654521 [Coprinopsis marcescibilis]|uniref:SnoaL-like domain-containing protein n=1 Tax=Coprinopsis marcescibilis TaxID=230819 RepID=A0A5C3KZS0_COPMA|nr:hypothetical protein FA15DRAFT_654521 [Coprinopsis marcescibilis]